MTQDAQQGVSEFVSKLAEFRESLAPDQRTMLDAILDAAQQSSDTSGQMMPNVYATEVMSRERINDWLADAEQDRQVKMARTGAGEESESPAPSRRFDWLYSWLPAVRSQEAH